MASSLFGSNAKPQASNPFQAAMAAAQELKHSNPEQLMEKMMEANPQFAVFVNQNKGKSPEQIARENGIVKKPTVDATATEPRITDELTGSEFLKAASNVDYAALMGVLDNHMSCIKAVCPKEYDAVMSQIYALR